MAKHVGGLDIVELVRTCGEMGVYRLKYRDLEVEFGHVWPQRRNEAVAKESELSHNIDEDDEVGQVDEDLVKDMKAAELLLEDPEMYERLHLGDGEL